jgi:class 3 adenylate cyclase/tetratricopeptide (TPR) repeat protein
VRPNAKFCAECGQKLTAATREGATKRASSDTQSPPAQPGSTAERRQLTVMFCDLVGSTGLAARLDPEDMREIIGTYQRCCAEHIIKSGGFVAKYMGDGVLAYFGYPQAHEDDAERAARTALALAEAVCQLQVGHDLALRVRVGIATGLVVVGDLVGEGDARERGVVGDAPNLAARLQALAEPGDVVISNSTRRLAGGMFEYVDLGRVDLKGMPEPAQAWKVTRRSALQSRFEAQHESSLTPLIGREEELELILRRWDKAKGGEGQVVLLSGEPGIGKSRLTVALQDRLEGEPHSRLRYFCSPHHADSALYPTIAQLELAAKFERDDPPGAKLDKLAALLGSSSADANDTRLLAELLSVPSGDRHAPLNFSPQLKKKRTFEALLRQLELLSRRKPTLILYEDVHWIDPSSRELLDITVEQVAGLPVLLIITFRPEFQPPWIGQAHVSMLSLSRLGRRHGAALVERVAGDDVLPPEVMAEIVERTDGVPLFVEELTKAVLEAETGGRGGTKTLSASVLPTLAVPATLHASLMARLDRLGIATKEIAQIGATIGREFSYELLARVAQSNEEEVKTALRRLTDAGLIFSRGTPPHATFLFKHALVRDAAYGTALRGPRMELHGRIAKTLDDRSETAETQPELLAHHFEEAGLADRALDYWRKAGERALTRSANLEAASHFRRGLKLVEALPGAPTRPEQELRFLIALGPALMMTQSSAAPEVSRVYSRARELALETGQFGELFQSIWGAWLSAWSRGDVPTAERLLEELFAIARGRDDPELLLQANHAAWPMFMCRGRFDEMWRQVQEGLSIYRRDQHAHHARLYGGHDPATCGYACGALVRAVTGYLDHAVELANQSTALARDLAHPPTSVHALWFAAEVRYSRREPSALEEAAAQLLKVVSEHGSAVGIANATMLGGSARVMRGDREGGLAELREGLAAWRATGSKFHASYRLARAADACRMTGLVDEGLALIAEALEVSDETDERWFLAEEHRLRGELLQLGGKDSGEVEAEYRRALDVARGQGAKTWELRASTSLARLWRDHGKRAEARGLLAPIHGWFSEGFGTPDLEEAEKLLNEIG